MFERIFDRQGRTVAHIVRIPDATYTVSAVRFLDPKESGGNPLISFTVEDAIGIPKVRMAWPYTPEKRFYEGGEGANAFTVDGDHVMGGSKFYPDSGQVGSYALFVADEYNNPISDIVGGLGLVDGNHSRYEIRFSNRSGGSSLDVLWKEIDALRARILRLEQPSGLTY